MLAQIGSVLQIGRIRFLQIVRIPSDRLKVLRSATFEKIGSRTANPERILGEFETSPNAHSLLGV